MTGTGTDSCVYPLPCEIRCPVRLFKILKSRLAWLFCSTLTTLQVLLQLPSFLLISVSLPLSLPTYSAIVSISSVSFYLEPLCLAMSVTGWCTGISIKYDQQSRKAVDWNLPFWSSCLLLGVINFLLLSRSLPFCCFNRLDTYICSSNVSVEHWADLLHKPNKLWSSNPSRGGEYITWRVLPSQIAG